MLDSVLNLSQNILFIHRALDWIDANLKLFNPSQRENFADRLRLTPIVELSIVCLYLHREPEFKQDARLKSFLEFISKIYTNLSIREHLLQGDETFISYAWIAIVLNTCGLLTGDYEQQVIQELVNFSNVQYREMLPFHRIELRNLLDFGNFTHRLPSYETLYQSSILSKPLNILYMTDRDIYSVTHVLFFLSDFGWRPLTMISPSQLEQICRKVEQRLKMCIQRKNWDLVGELLICYHCLGENTSMLYRAGWQALIDAQWESGAVPGPNYKQMKSENFEDSKQQEYVFQQCYHTTLVAALGGALCHRKTVNEVDLRL